MKIHLCSSLCISVYFSFFKNFFHLFTMQNDKRKRQRQYRIFHLLLCSSNGHNGKGEATLKPGARKWIWVSSVAAKGWRTWAVVDCISEHLNRELTGSKASGAWTSAIVWDARKWRLNPLHHNVKQYYFLFSHYFIILKFNNLFIYFLFDKHWVVPVWGCHQKKKNE